MQSSGTTDSGGFALAAQALEFSIDALSTPEMHPQIRVGHALLWANVLNDAYHREGGDAYVSMRDQNADGRVLPGLRLAFNALKHGAAVCTEIRPDVTGVGWAAGPWVLTGDVDALARTLSRPPTPAQRTSYVNEVGGRRLVEPFAKALEWFEQAANHLSI